MNMIQKARAYAIDAHRDTRYGDLPYDYHLKMVAMLVGPTASQELVAAAWLHDAVEDTHVTLHDVRQTFGGHVAQLVDCVTDGDGDNRKERKAAMYKKLAAGPMEARRLKLADRVANTRASIESPKRAAMYAKEFPEFIRIAGVEEDNNDLIVQAMWLYVNYRESIDG
jgi:(p)ppGpp synthase/HD superfamily hydrolase